MIHARDRPRDIVARFRVQAKDAPEPRPTAGPVDEVLFPPGVERRSTASVEELAPPPALPPRPPRCPYALAQSVAPREYDLAPTLMRSRGCAHSRNH